MYWLAGLPSNFNGDVIRSSSWISFIWPSSLPYMAVIISFCAGGMWEILSISEYLSELHNRVVSASFFTNSLFLKISDSDRKASSKRGLSGMEQQKPIGSREEEGEMLQRPEIGHEYVRTFSICHLVRSSSLLMNSGWSRKMSSHSGFLPSWYLSPKRLCPNPASHTSKAEPWVAQERSLPSSSGRCGRFRGYALYWWVFETSAHACFFFHQGGKHGGQFWDDLPTVPMLKKR